MLERAHRHGAAQLLAQRHHGHAQARNGLVPNRLLLLALSGGGIVPLRLLLGLGTQVLRAHVQQLLDAQHGTRASVGAHLQRHHAQLAHSRVEDLRDLHRRLDGFLLVEENQAQAQAHEAGGGLRQLLRRAAHQRLADGARHLLIAAAHVDHAQAERCHARGLHAQAVLVERVAQQLVDLLLAAARVRQAQAHNRARAHVGVLVPHGVAQKGKRGIALVANARVHHAHREQRARHHMRVGRVQVLVDLRQAAVDVPQRDRAQRRRRGDLAVVLVLVEPADSAARAGLGGWRGHELVRAEAGVYERVDVGRREVGARTVDRRRGGLATVDQVRLVDVLGRLGLHDVQIASEREVRLRKARVADGLRERLALVVV
mmetsp:Transcript_6730/g.27458  ORF Transcript_6730/g.27458 Transcript_6730/m.27458 type:complete len:373 (+) Transcript_6730:773-1891(+)